jgi:immune inhibitor A
VPPSAISPATAAPPVNPPASSAVRPSDELPNALEAKRRAMREEALTDVLAGRAKPVTTDGSTVVRVGREAGARTSDAATARSVTRGLERNQYVELSREKTDKIFVILAEFGNQRHADFPDKDQDPKTPGPATFEGPLHNKIPQPDRTKDNSTVWQADYDRQHYQALYFGTGENSVASYYEKQSPGRYTVDGEVTDWVKVPYNEARYGCSNGYSCAGNLCQNRWELVRDAVNLLPPVGPLRLRRRRRR